MKPKIVIAGGTGFIGRYFRQQFKQAGYDVIVISRKDGDIQWRNNKGIVEAIEDSKLLINMAGKSVDCRYNEQNKMEILKSRTETTRILGEAILKCKVPPSLWINSSTATIYRHAEDHPMTELNGEIGTGFSVNVAKAWEKAFFDFHLNHTRQVALRTAIVLGPGGGVIKPMHNLVRFGLGGKQGNGKQIFSWIHIADLFSIVQFIMTHDKLKGVFNCSSPNPVTNANLMHQLREKTKAQFGLPTPAWLLKIGAILIRTETELILKSRWVVPEKLLKAGYTFKYPELDKALENILNGTP